MAFETAITRARARAEEADARDCIDWLATAQLRMGELLVTLVTRVRNN